MRSARSTLAIMSAGVLCGCAQMTPGLGFDDVQRDVRSRTGATTHWDRSTVEDLAARTALQDLLARELTPDAAVQIALLNNRELQATYEDLDIAQADLVRAGLLQNPIFSGAFRFDTGGGGTGVDLDVAQDFLSLFTIPLRRARAGAAFEAAKARVTRIAVETAYETRAAFYTFQAAQEVHALRQSVEQATALSVDLSRRLREAGNTRELDDLNEQALHEQSRLDREVAAANVIQARERLNSLMGLWGGDTIWTTAARLPQLPELDDSDDLERRAVAASLELAEARAQIEQAAVSARLARPLAWLQGSEAGVAAEREVEGGWSVGPAFALPIPIFDLGGSEQGEAVAKLRQVTSRYYATAVRVRASARAAASALQSARSRVLQHQTIILPLNEKIVNQAQLQYNAMQLSAFQLLQAKRDQITAGVSSIEALLDYWIARAAAQRTLGGGVASISSYAATTPALTSRDTGAHR